ncbi:MAG TPA: polysaccharide deacetylase family protein [Flavisolibacter sp.]|nr:polysaccharide deacetylase family protein [Flavisolibacter sp.]
MKKTILALSLFALVQGKATAQTATTWNGKSCAVVLTYDDGLNVDLTNAIPALDSFGLKGTFYISDYANQLNKQIPGWRKAAANGHELANHSIWHACEGGRSGREFVKGDYDLRYYTVRRATDEARGMNNILKAIDGKDKRTFAFPCGDTKIHDTAYIEGMHSDFVAARGVHGDMPTIDKVKLYDLPCYMINGQSGAELIALVKQAMQTHTLLVFLFHGVGGEHGLNVSLPAHRQLLQFLKAAQKQVWTAPMIDVAEYIKTYQSKKST